MIFTYFEVPNWNPHKIYDSVMPIAYKINIYLKADEIYKFYRELIFGVPFFILGVHTLTYVYYTRLNFNATLIVNMGR